MPRFCIGRLPDIEVFSHYAENTPTCRNKFFCFIRKVLRFFLEKITESCLTGTGNFDLVAYQKFNDGIMDDYVPTDEELEASFAKLPKVE